jgi:predicted DNA-binding transcriptional regulator AlpA
MEAIEPGTTGRRSPTRTARKLPARQVCQRYGFCDKTLDRWCANEKLNFPKPMYVNKRRYFDEDELDEFDRRQRSEEAA